MENQSRQPYLALVGWDVKIANELAVEQGVRYVEYDFSWQLNADPDSSQYEHRRPAEILELCQGRREILEIHDRPDAVGEYAVMGYAWQHRLLRAAAALGIRSIIIDTELQNLANRHINALIVDLCRGDGLPDSEARIADNVSRLRYCMEAMANDTLPLPDMAADFDYFAFVKDITATQAKLLGLEDGQIIPPFGDLSERDVQLLRLDARKTYVAQCWNGINSSNGKYYGTVLEKLDMDFTERPTARADFTDLQDLFLGSRLPRRLKKQLKRISATL
jgi:hypothetical protein